MSEIREITVWGVDLEVEYEFDTERDPYGTGDSPTHYTVEIITITIGGIDMTDLLIDSFVNEIEDEILRVERG